jgi:phage terminase small subunit
MPRPKVPKPTKKQELFAKEFLVDLNQTQAAIRAGYSEHTAAHIASENVRKPDVQALIQLQMDKRSQRTEINADYVLYGIKEVYERCMQKVEVLDSNGEPTGVWRFEPNAALKGLELLGKNLKLFTDKHEHSGKDGGPIQHTVGNFTPEQLRRMAEEMERND